VCDITEIRVDQLWEQWLKHQRDWFHWLLSGMRYASLAQNQAYVVKKVSSWMKCDTMWIRLMICCITDISLTLVCLMSFRITQPNLSRWTDIRQTVLGKMALNEPSLDQPMFSHEMYCLPYYNYLQRITSKLNRYENW